MTEEAGTSGDFFTFDSVALFTGSSLILYRRSRRRDRFHQASHGRHLELPVGQMDEATSNDVKTSPMSAAWFSIRACLYRG